MHSDAFARHLPEMRSSLGLDHPLGELVDRLGRIADLAPIPRRLAVLGGIAILPVTAGEFYVHF